MAAPVVDGQSVHALECHGGSKDCNLGAVPCFGVSSQTPNVAAAGPAAIAAPPPRLARALGPAPKQASCVPFASAGDCVLVCQNENQSFGCPSHETVTCRVGARGQHAHDRNLQSIIVFGSEQSGRNGNRECRCGERGTRLSVRELSARNSDTPHSTGLLDSRRSPESQRRYLRLNLLR